jgi:DNA-binding Lrp family transcriptional regulator
MIDETDRRIIRRLERGLSESMTPYADAAASLGIQTEELIGRLERMSRSGAIRSLRAVCDQRLLGFAGNVLVAWAVPPRRVDEVGGVFAARREVSHCVLREDAPDWPYNLYTMVHARTIERAEAAVAEMEEASGVSDRVVLETVRQLKRTPPGYF